MLAFRASENSCETEPLKWTVVPYLLRNKVPFWIDAPLVPETKVSPLRVEVVPKTKFGPRWVKSRSYQFHWPDRVIFVASETL